MIQRFHPINNWMEPAPTGQYVLVGAVLQELREMYKHAGTGETPREARQATIKEIAEKIKGFGDFDRD